MGGAPSCQMEGGRVAHSCPSGVSLPGGQGTIMKASQCRISDTGFISVIDDAAPVCALVPPVLCLAAACVAMPKPHLVDIQSWRRNARDRCSRTSSYQGRGAGHQTISLTVH